MSMNRNEERSLTGAAPVTVNSRHGPQLPFALAERRARSPSLALQWARSPGLGPWHWQLSHVELELEDYPMT